MTKIKIKVCFQKKFKIVETLQQDVSIRGVGGDEGSSDGDYNGGDAGGGGGGGGG